MYVISNGYGISKRISGVSFESLQIAGADSEQRQKVEKYLEQLAPVKLGKDGEIMEWGMQVPETEPGHRHFSHLFSLYPGHQFMKPQNSVLKNAAEISLKRRMENGGGAHGMEQSMGNLPVGKTGAGR